MRLSEAIMLGAATCKMEAGEISTCAYGVALRAVGGDFEYPYSSIMDAWRWTEVWFKDSDGHNCRSLSDLARSVWRKFDNEVCDGKITLEQLADYVRSIEPDCDCNRFNCDCKAKQEAVAEVEHARLELQP